MRIEHDKIGSFREATDRMVKGPSNTFKCCRCGGCKSVFGRRKVGDIGRRKLWACKACFEGEGK